MRHRCLYLSLLLVLCSISAVAQKVLEPGSHLSIEGKTARISLSLDTSRRLENIPASIELTDPNGAVRARSDINVPSILPGRQTNIAILQV